MWRQCVYCDTSRNLGYSEQERVGGGREENKAHDGRLSAMLLRTAGADVADNVDVAADVAGRFTPPMARLDSTLSWGPL